MLRLKRQLSMSAIALACALIAGRFTVHADRGHAGDDDHEGDGSKKVKKVFVIAMENHNWTQPAALTDPHQIFKNPAAPFINSLVDGTSGISKQVSYATNYVNPKGFSVHPSEPNYVWTEAGQAFHTLGTDADPYDNNVKCTPQTVIDSDQHLTAFLTKAHKTWRSYQEDTNVDTNNVPLPSAMWLYPLFSLSGKFTAPPTGRLNEYNYTSQFNYAPKHNPQIFFRDTNGGCPQTHTTLYPPLQQLALDLAADNLADYTWITPDQYNDQHSILGTGYGIYPNNSDQAAIAQGDNFVARVVPLIMSSDAYEDGAVIALWWDESEHGSLPDSNDFKIPFIIISKSAHANVGGKPYASSVEFSHSSLLRTMQEVFNVDPDEGYPFLADAVNANDLSPLFKPGTIK